MANQANAKMYCNAALGAVSLSKTLLSSVGSPYSLAMLERLSQGSHLAFSSLDPSEYDNWYDFGLDYACFAYLRKFEGSADAPRLHRESEVDFEQVESQNRQRNRYLRSDAPWLLPGVECCFSAARRKIAKILGPFNVDEFLDSCEWGPGATSSLKASVATLDKKILEPYLSCTRRAAPVMKSYLERDIHMFSARFNGIIPDGPYSVVPHLNFFSTESSRFTTVPKDWKSRRGIDIQPTCNLFLQKGVGTMIRRRLRRVGVDLDDQSRNQWLASVAQRLQLCTIDLAKASDSVSLALVEDLLPREWFAVLHSLRTDYTRIRDRDLYLHKFSAMGNGYTFELESLIFYALIQGVIDFVDPAESPIVGVYGDDLIIERRYAKGVLRILDIAGFTVNTEKSYISGRFFESCGKHYFDGRDVTPLFQKEEISDVPSAIRAANRIFRFALRLGGGWFLDKRVVKPYQHAVRQVQYFMDELNARRWISCIERGVKEPLPIGTPVGPHWLVDDESLICARQFNRGPHGGFSIGVVRSVAIKIDADHIALYATSLRRGCVVDFPFKGFVSPRGKTRTVFGRRNIASLHYRVPAWY